MPDRINFIELRVKGMILPVSSGKIGVKHFYKLFKMRVIGISSY
jgi:hypothetical protein